MKIIAYFDPVMASHNQGKTSGDAAANSALQKWRRHQSDTTSILPCQLRPPPTKSTFAQAILPTIFPLIQTALAPSSYVAAPKIFLALRRGNTCFHDASFT
jgi:hypothetical protein